MLQSKKIVHGMSYNKDQSACLIVTDDCVLPTTFKITAADYNIDKCSHFNNEKMKKLSTSRPTLDSSVLLHPLHERSDF
jgi:hypothetical protein